MTSCWMFWISCCRNGFSELSRDYGESRRDEEYELHRTEPLCNGRSVQDVHLTQPQHIVNGSESSLQVPEEMQSLIAEVKGKGEEERDVVVKGWLSIQKRSGVSNPWLWSRLRKYWFVLYNDSLEYYSSSEKNAKRLGTLVLTSLCSVVLPSKQTYKETGYWNFIVYGRKHCYRLHTKDLKEALQWVNAIQKVIDSVAPTETPTQLLIRDIKENSSNLDVVEEIYKRNSVLQHTKEPLYAPLLAFPYGSLDQTGPSSKGYTSLREEAVKLFNSLQQLEAERDPIPLMQGILQTCFDLQPLIDEVYCQLLRQTTGTPHPGDQADLRYWQLLTCMSCTFVPEESILQFLNMHLNRTQRLFPETEMAKYAEFISESLLKTKLRQCVPSCEEILVLMHRQEMVCTIHLPGSGSCKITISSHTTAEEVVQKIIQDLGLEHSHNIFALYEQSSLWERAVGKETIIADILTRFENLMSDEKCLHSQWRLCFKLYCLLDTDRVPKDSIEYKFIFEQAHETMIRGCMAVAEETLQSLAALRLQYLNSDFSTHTPYPRLEEIFPMGVIQAHVYATKTLYSSKCCSKSFPNTLFPGALHNGLWTNALQKLKAEEDQQLIGRMKEEGTAVMTAIIEKWKQLQGLTKEESMLKYLTIAKEWPGFGSSLFEVDLYMNSGGSLISKLWLGIDAKAVSIYQQGEPEPFETYCYSQIASYGKLDKNTFKITVDEKDLIFETNKVDDIIGLIQMYLTCNGRKHHRLRTESGSETLHP
ncbi:pleckstrin homology domain-containing family H member 3 [Protopterus annectens]|uniref:pleckstrin homology domain-containing family H member 3 n=1 Tax=Protopterus annectens TaxID=7888 RepID=UPI001CFB076F|nr:pleckstrin homology domain-containing family H member 3 [Protopterus annectens]